MDELQEFSGLVSQVLNLKGIINTPALWFLLGLFIVPFIYAAFVQPEIYIEATPFMLIIAGVLVGFGTRLGSGCTSGHGICGISSFIQTFNHRYNEFLCSQALLLCMLSVICLEQSKMKNVWAYHLGWIIFNWSHAFRNVESCESDWLFRYFWALGCQSSFCDDGGDCDCIYSFFKKLYVSHIHKPFMVKPYNFLKIRKSTEN